MQATREARAAVRRGWLLFAGVVAVVLGSDALVLWHHLDDAPHPFDVWLECTLIGPIAAATAGIILAHHPRHRMGRVFAVLAAIAAVQLLTGSVAALESMNAIPRSLAVVAAHVEGAAAAAVIPALIVPALLFPYGKPLTSRWRYVVGAILVLGAVGCLSEPLYEKAGHPAYPMHQLTTPVPKIFNTIGAAGYLLGVASAILCLALRWKRGDTVLRMQLKWVVFPLVSGVVFILTVLPVVVDHYPALDALGDVGWALTTATIPVGTTIAIMRYRLYDIDRFISKTLGYALITGVLVAVYVGVVTASSALVPDRYGSVGIAIATLIVAALFIPLRRRVQSVIDRRFNRSRYDAQRIVDDFALRLRAGADPDAVHADLITVLHRTLAPSHASVWLVDTVRS